MSNDKLLSNMDRAVLSMPRELAFAGDMAQLQYHERVQALIRRIDAHEAEKQAGNTRCGGPGGAHRYTYFGDQKVRRCADCGARETEKQAGPVAGEASAPALGERPRLLTMLPEARAALAALERIACNQTSQDHAEQFTHLREYLLSQQPATPPAPPSESDKEDAENYRWLANNCDGDAQDDFIQMIARNVLSRAEFDAAIRAARAKKEQP